MKKNVDFYNYQDENEEGYTPINLGIIIKTTTHCVMVLFTHVNNLTCLSIHLSFCLSILPSIIPFIHLSIYLSICQLSYRWIFPYFWVPMYTSNINSNHSFYDIRYKQGVLILYYIILYYIVLYYII